MIIYWQRDRDPMALGCVIFALVAYITFFAGFHNPDWLWLLTIQTCFVYALAGMIHYRHVDRMR